MKIFHIYIYMYVCMYVCVYICVYMQTPKNLKTDAPEADFQTADPPAASVSSSSECARAPGGGSGFGVQGLGFRV